MWRGQIGYSAYGRDADFEFRSYVVQDSSVR